MWYTIKKTNYDFEIKKLLFTDEPIEAWFTKVFNCSLEDSEVEINKQISDNKINISLPKCISCNENDENFGLYNLHIKIGSKVYDKIIFPYYPNILKSLIEDLEKILCGCPCPTCEDCVEKDELLNVTFKTIFYYSLSGNYYQQTFGNALKCIGCDLTKEAICLLLNEKIYGSKTNKRFLKRLLAIFYLTFYYTENTLNCDKDYTNDLFNIKSIKYCLDNLGIDLKCIKNQIEKNNIQTGDAYLNINDISHTTITKDYFLKTSPPYYNDKNKNIKSIEITSLNIGTNRLELNYQPVNVGDIILFEDIKENKLIFIFGNDITDNYKIGWKIKEFDC